MLNFHGERSEKVPIYKTKKEMIVKFKNKIGYDDEIG
jgi:hypothetical protein